MSSSTPLHDLTIAQASKLIADHDVSPVELIEGFLRRIEAVDGDIHSYVALDGDRALAMARDAEREIMARGPRSPLHGLPYGLKDNIAAVGLPMAAGSRLRLGETPDADATAHRLLKDAGGILLGKLHTYEYGTGTGADLFELPFAPARNPWNLAHFTGGSSTGAGAAVAAGTAMFALGADTGGSVRLPAAGCGVAGLKPTYGRVSRAGLLPNCYSLDHVGPLAQTAEDIAAIMGVIARHDPTDPASANVAPMAGAFANLHAGVRGSRIGVLRRFHARDLRFEDEAVAAFERSVEVFRDLGAELVEIDLAFALGGFLDCARLINMSECYAIHERDFRDRRRVMGSALRNKLSGGAVIATAQYIDAQRLRGRLARAVDAAIRSCDAVLTIAANPAPRLDVPQAIADFTNVSATMPFSLSGHPAISLCNGFSSAGLPTSLQIVGGFFDEADILRVAVAYERATAWTAQRAPAGRPAMSARRQRRPSWRAPKSRRWDTASPPASPFRRPARKTTPCWAPSVCGSMRWRGRCSPISVCPMSPAPRSIPGGSRPENHLSGI